LRLEERRAGQSNADGWRHNRAWASHRSAVWEVEDRRKNNGLSDTATELGEKLAGLERASLKRLERSAAAKIPLVVTSVESLARHRGHVYLHIIRFSSILSIKSSLLMFGVGARLCLFDNRSQISNALPCFNKLAVTKTDAPQRSNGFCQRDDCGLGGRAYPQTAWANLRVLPAGRRAVREKEVMKLGAIKGLDDC